MANKLIPLLRAVRFVLHLCYGLTLALFYPWLRLSRRRRILQRWSNGLLRIFNVNIVISDDDPLHTLGHGLIVTNHVSWLDVFVLNAVVPMRFVAKSEVRTWPIIGWLCARAQTLFIERGKARSAARVNLQMVELLRNGECLAIFPEGTTTDGMQVEHFHSSLLQPAIDAEAQVFPIAIRYQDGHGTHSTIPAYIGDTSFGASLWNILSAPELHVRLITSATLDAATSDRRTLTQMAHQQISAALASAHAASGLSMLPPSAQPSVETQQHFQSLYCVLLNPALDHHDFHAQEK